MCLLAISLTVLFVSLRSDLIAVANENAARLDVEESVRKAEIEQEAQLLKIENERLAHLRACEEVERAQRMVEEERKRGEILAIQDQAILRAQAEEDLAWFEKEKVLKDELIAEQKALRHKEDLARKREHLGAVDLSTKTILTNILPNTIKCV